MLLAIDIGNTHITLGLYAGDSIERVWRLETVATRTEDEYGLTVVRLVEQAGLVRADVDSAMIASVVPTLTQPFVALVEQCFSVSACVVGPGLKTGVSVLYDPPRDVGADRIVNAVAAYHRFRSACIVVDFGTATTLDSVTARGAYAGGAIVPGVLVSMQALFDRTAKLPRVDLARPSRVVGKSTAESIQSGVYFGYAALVDGLVRRIKQEMKDDPVRVVATGGLAPVLAEATETIETVDATLTLEGLRLLHIMNQS